jgi:SAM-dependent methyltransferase
MHLAVRRQLLEINREFYQTHAASFVATRTRLQPGAARVLSRVDPEAAVLDLGCGPGLAAEALAAGGHRGPYLGLDSSPWLISMAQGRVRETWARFLPADLADPHWSVGLTGGFDWALAFAVLHHLPDAGLRRRVLRRVRRLQPTGARAAISVWDFQRSERLRRRVIPWQEVGLVEEQVDPGDALLDWRHEGRGLRYVHHFSSAELADLAAAAGYRVEQEFQSDGENGRLGLYQVWRASDETCVVESAPPG